MEPRIITWLALDRKVLCVAVEGEVSDWAAYIGSVPGHDHKLEAEEVARTGSKLPSVIAKLLFPGVAKQYRWRA